MKIKKTFWAQCYTTFYGVNLRIFVISWSVCSCQAFPVSCLWVRPGIQPRMKHLKGALPRQTLAFLTNIRQGWKDYTGTYRDKHSSLLRKFINYCRKKFYNIRPRRLSLKASFLSLTLRKNKIECLSLASKHSSLIFVGKVQSRVILNG